MEDPEDVPVVLPALSEDPFGAEVPPVVSPVVDEVAEPFASSEEAGAKAVTEPPNVATKGSSACMEEKTTSAIGAKLPGADVCDFVVVADDEPDVVVEVEEELPDELEAGVIVQVPETFDTKITPVCVVGAEILTVGVFVYVPTLGPTEVVTMTLGESDVPPMV